jgi:hypothetical protein
MRPHSETRIVSDIDPYDKHRALDSARARYFPFGLYGPSSFTAASTKERSTI